MAKAAVVAAVAAGLALRAVLYAVPGLHETLAARPELVTPVSSLRRVQESVYLFEQTGSPYAGDVFHQPVLVFALFYPIFAAVPAGLQYAVMCAFFMAVDAAIAFGFARLCRRTLLLEEGRVPTCNGEEIWLHKVPVSPLFRPELLPAAVSFIYLLNPFSLATSVAMSTVSLTHLAVLYSLVFAAEGALVASTLCVAIGGYLSVYPIFLLVPITLLLSFSTAKNSQNTSDDTVVATNPSLLLVLKCVTLVGVWAAWLLYISWTISGDWSFLESTYLWVARYSDLTPNVGIFWYFFMEVFDRFIPYFLFVMHIHPCIYIIPIFMRMAARPQSYACVLIGIFTLFQAYPCFGDFSFFLTMMALHPKTIMLIGKRYVYALGLAVATCMLPVMWFLWLFPASGNANFFYNQTLVYQIFNSQLINAFVGASMKRDKDLLKFRKYMSKSE